MSDGSGAPARKPATRGGLGLAQRSVDGPRLLGLALLIGGVALIRR